MVARGDLLGFRILNLTGREVVLYDPLGAVRQRLPSAGSVRWQNASLRLAQDFLGLPVYDFRMNALSMPPKPDNWHPVKNPLYVLVDPFTAMALSAMRACRPDVLVAVDYDNDPVTGEMRVRALGHVPLR
jgi:hypothetical protein